MKKNKCRICNSELFKDPVLVLKNMPKRAQFLPSRPQLKYDAGVDLDIFQCQFCGVIQLKNRPVSYYRSVIRAAGISEEMKNFRINQFTKFVKEFSLEGKKVIEIGCGAGEYLSLINSTGVISYGIEYEKASVSECLKKGLKVFRGFIEDGNYKIKDSPFDAFFILSFLEHVPDPCSLLKGIHNNLTEDGVGIVEVPNFDMILKKRLLSEFMLDHLFYFTEETLKTVLNINGFEIVACNEIWHDYIISAIVRKRKKLELTILVEQNRILCEKIDKFLSGFPDGKVAIWGAGHQTLALLSFLKQLKKIRYVVDSAPFKQDRYTPVTHIPIVSPEKLDSDPVEGIIVAAGSYSGEVLNIIKNRYHPGLRTAVMCENDMKVV